MVVRGKTDARSRVGLWGIAALTSLVGCISIPQNGPRSTILTTGGSGFTLGHLPFPSRAEVEAILRTPPAPPPAPTAIATVDQWTFAGPYPTYLGELLATTDPSQEYITTLFGQDPRVVRLTSMRCLAREEARLRALHAEALPTALTRQIRTRCGVLGGSVHVRSLTLRVPDTEPEERVRRSLFDGARAQFGDALPAGESREIGVEYSRSQGTAILVLATAAPVVAITPGPRTADASGMVHLEGRVIEPAADIAASINRGDDGSASCEVDARVAAPAFHIRCPLEAGRSATVEVFRRVPDSFVDRALFSTEVGDPAVYPAEFRRTPASGPRPSAEGYRTQLMELLNAARARVGAAPVTLLPRQSQAVCALAPWAVAAAQGALTHPQNQSIILTMGAGWQVTEPVANTGTFLHVSPTADVHQSFEEQFAQPMARRQMLDRGWTRVALCPSTDAAGALVAVQWCFYETLDVANRPADATTLFAEINRRRASQSLPPSVAHEGLAAIAERAVQRIMANNGSEAARAIDDAMREAVDAYGRSTEGRPGARVSAWWVILPPQSAPRIPDDLVVGPARPVGLSVAYVQVPSTTWGARVAMVLALDPG